MSNDNPYVLSGFADGFTRGLDLYWRQHDRMQAEEDRKLQRQYQEEDRQYKLEDREQQTKLGRLQLEKGEQDVKLGQLNVQEAEAKAPFYAESAQAEADNKRGQGAEARARARLLDEQTTASKDYRRASEYEAQIDEANKIFGEHLAEEFKDPTFIENGRLVDDIFTGNQANEQMLQQHKTTVMNWVHRAAKPVWDRGVGKPLNPQVAAKLGLDPKTAKVISIVPVDIRVNNERGTAVFELSVTAADANGNEKTYPAPMTEGRTSNPDDPVKEIPLWKLEQAAQAGGKFAHAADEIGRKGGNIGDVSAWIKGRKASGPKGKGTGSSKGWKSTNVPGMFLNGDTGEVKYNGELINDIQAQQLAGKFGLKAIEIYDTPEEAAAAGKKFATEIQGGQPEEQEVHIYMPGAEPQ